MNINPLQIRGYKLRATSEPNNTDDVTKGYLIGSIWMTDSILKKAFICIDHTAGNAIWLQIGGSSGGGVTDLIPANSFSSFASVKPGDIVRLDITTKKYVLARSNDIQEAEVVGIIITKTAIDATILTHGYFNIPGQNYTPGGVYYLDWSVPGLAVNQEPILEGLVSKPLFIGKTATSGYFYNWRGIVIHYHDDMLVPTTIPAIVPNTVIPPINSNIQTFTNANLMAGKITITHPLNEQYPNYTLYDSSGRAVLPTNFRSINTTQVEIDLTTMIPISGTWTIKLVK